MNQQMLITNIVCFLAGGTILTVLLTSNADKKLINIAVLSLSLFTLFCCSFTLKHPQVDGNRDYDIAELKKLTQVPKYRLVSLFLQLISMLFCLKTAEESENEMLAMINENSIVL